MKLAGAAIGADRPFFLIAGPCVVESAQLSFDVAGKLKEITGRLGIPFVFKASYDKANRSSRASYRGPGIEAGLKVLADVKRQFGLPVLTDVHEDTPFAEVAAVVDVLQTPAFLARQTNFIVNVCSQGKPVLARAAVGAGVAGLFMETHPDPDKALSDGPNAWPLDRMERLLATLVALDRDVKSQPYEESLL